MGQWVGQNRASQANSQVGFRIDATTKAIACVFVAEQAKAPKKVWVYVHTETGVSPAYECRIETLTSYQPSGSLYDANATGTFTATATGWISATFSSTPAALTVGSMYAVVVTPSGTPDASNYIEVRYVNAAYARNRKRLEKTAGSWSSAAGELGCAIIVIEFDDADVLWPFLPDQHILLSTPSGVSADGTNMRGVKFTPSVSGTLKFIRTQIRLSSGSADLTLVLRAVGGGADLATFTVAAAQASTGNVDITVAFATPPSVTAGTEYVFYLRTTAGTAWQLWLSGMSASCPILPPHLLGMKYVTGTTEPPNTEDAQYHPIFGYWVDPTPTSGGGGPLIGPGRLVR